MMTPTSLLRDSSPWFADVHFGPCHDKFVDIPSVNYFGASVVYVFRTLQILVFQPVFSLWTKLSILNTVNLIVRAWTITSFKFRYLPSFLKQGYEKENKKDNMIRSILSFQKIFMNLQKINTVWLILSSQGFFLNFHQKLVLYIFFKHLLKILNQGQYWLTHTSF